MVARGTAEGTCGSHEDSPLGAVELRNCCWRKSYWVAFAAKSHAENPLPGRAAPGTSSAVRRRLTGGQYLIRSRQTPRCKGKGLGFLSPGSRWERCGVSQWGCSSDGLFLRWISTGPVPDLPSCGYGCRSQKLPIVKAQLFF